MSPSHKPTASNSVRAQAAQLPNEDHRQSYLFEQRINAMESRINESGLPNETFPFIAAKCVATPEWNVLKEAPNFYNAVCVLKGLRPVALLSAKDVQRDTPFRDHLLRAMEEKGLTVCADPLLPDYIVGDPARVAAVHRIIKHRMETGDYSERYHRELGQALAYPAIAIERFLRLIATGENALEAAMIEQAFPTGDESSVRVRLPSGRIAAVR